MERTLDVTRKLVNDDVFSVTIRDVESGLSETFDQNTHSIEEKIGVEIMSWLDMMEVE